MTIDIICRCVNEAEDAGNRHGRDSGSRARQVSCCTGHGLDDIHHLPRPSLWHRPLLPPSGSPPPFSNLEANEQHYRIINRKSSEGISPYFLLLGGTSSSSAFLNILILQKEILACCQFTVRPFRFDVILTYRQNGHVSYSPWE
jgi:hypothetical protein